MNSERTKIYFETYFFYYENTDRSFHVRNNNNYNWTFQFSDDCDFFIFSEFLDFKKKNIKKLAFFKKIMSFFLFTVSAFLMKNSFLINLSIFHFLIFFCHFNDIIFFFRNFIFWFFRICFFCSFIYDQFVSICFSDFFSCQYVNVFLIFEDSQIWCIDSMCQKQ